MKRRIFLLSMPIMLLACFFVFGVSIKNVAAEEIAIDTVWNKDEVRVIDDGGLVIMPGVKLTVEAGTIIKLAPNNMILAMGELDIRGNAIEPVIITSLRDDSTGGDTNGDGAATAPAPGDWYGVMANSSNAKIKIDYAKISYGGSYDDSPAYLLDINQGAEFSLEHSSVINNNGYMMFAQAPSVKINYSNIYNPDFCLSEDPFGMGVAMAYCGGSALMNMGGNSIDAANNYWGHENGPTIAEQVSGPEDIKGTLIGGNINYQPFLIEPWVSALESAEPDPVIIVPGIMGSYNISGRWQIDPIFHTYDNLMEALVAAGYKENSLGEAKPTLFTFPYNWRVGNNITANLLKEKIQQVKEISGRDKVDIIAHSMGGLVTRSYVEGSDYQNDIDQVVFLGTPHLGAVKTYLSYEGAVFSGGWDWLQKYLFQTEAALNGYFDLADYIRARVLTVEQLLPIYNYLKDKQSDNSWLLRIYPLNYSQNNYLENLNSPENIELLKQRVKITNIVSDLGGNSTLNNIKVIPDPDITDNKWQSGYPENLEQNLDSLEKGNGDSTVPLNSANSLNGVETIMSGISDHENLPTIMQKEIIKSLTGKMPENYYNSRLTSAFKRWAFFRVYSPVDFIVIAPNGNKIGKDFNNNTEINEIPDAFYSGFNDQAEFVLIPNPQDGEYKIEIQGVDNGGEYVLASSIINDNSEISKEFKGTIAPEQAREFNITYSAASENPIGDLEPVDTVPPIVIINKPAENEKYLHSENLIIDYIATDDFSGLATTTIMIDDQILATATIDLFNFSLGRHDLIIQARDKSGNLKQAQIKFEIIANIDSTISDIEEIHSRGWLKGRIYKPLLASAFRLLKIEAKYFEKEQALLEKLIRKTRDDKKLSDKQKQKLIEQYNKNLDKLKKNRIKAIDKSLDAIVKLLNLAKKQNQINQAGYDIIINDINYLKLNL
ncbi:MAG: hypothetical protein PHF50_00865 [Patescibacteria group bacterium]|nr:hypothetical protein [Patescibacteria group bacterium]